VQRLHIKLVVTLDRHEAHLRSSHRLGNHFGIDVVVLVRLHVGLHVLGWHQPHFVALLAQPATQEPTGRDEASAPEASIGTRDKPPCRAQSELGQPFHDVEGKLVSCRVDELRPHPGYVRNHIGIPASQLSPLAELGDLVFREPLLITQDRTILDGYARWNLARQRGWLTLPCIEYDLPEAEALYWLLQKHRRSNGLNAFSRILLALELEPWLKEQAKSNQRVGGQNRGSSKLTEAEKVDVRSKIAAAAGVSAGNVSKVKQLTVHAPPEILQALREGDVSIHRASLWLRTPGKQDDQLRLHRNLRGMTRKIDSLLRAHRQSNSAGPGDLDVQRIGSALAAMDSRRKTSVLISAIRVPGEVLLLSTELLQALASQGELHL
jgi:hypothetical protein